MVRRIAILALLFLAGTQVFAQSPVFHRRHGGGGAGCTSPPFFTNFTASFTTGDLEGQYGWDDKSGAPGDDFKVTSGSGVYGNEPSWTNATAAIDGDNCVLTSAKQWASFIYYAGSGTSGGGSGWGVCVRSNSTGDTLVWCTYDKSGYLGIGHRKGTTFTQYTSWAGTLSNDDSITVLVDGTTFQVYQNSTQRINSSDGTMPNTDTLRYLGLVAVGDEGATWFIKRFSGGTW